MKNKITFLLLAIFFLSSCQKRLGAPVDTHGITLDVDSDGVPDYQDKEPFSPPGYVFESQGYAEMPPVHSSESYAEIVENEFNQVKKQPLSTFSIDVDRAAYANVRRYINDNQKPPVDAVRIEEMVNYFEYDYPQPSGEHPFSVNTELADCPWNEKHQILQIGIQGKEIDLDKTPKSNLVFLLDVSGSMNSSDKLPLLKSALKMLVNHISDKDRVAIVVYAGAAGVVLESTAGSQKRKILDALEQLEAGGSTAGGEGIILAYDIAKKNFIKGGNNRIILATDGDFNVGASSDEEMEKLITKKRDQGVFLTVLGFGTGNYKDSKMETLADKGNGNYAYIDNILEAKKVLVNEMGGTFFTIAKDVKLQLEFNPVHVKAYRLVGYENRMLAARDFNDDTKDAGELGAGHTVTALYEIIPAKEGEKEKTPETNPLIYQKNVLNLTDYATTSNELLTINLRYKKPDAAISQLLAKPVLNEPSSRLSENFRFATAVASFGLLLRDSKHKGTLTYGKVLEMARSAKGIDEKGYRAEMIKLVETCELLFLTKKRRR